MLVMEMKCIRPFDTKLIELEIQEIDSINISPAGCEFFFYFYFFFTVSLWNMFPRSSLTRLTKLYNFSFFFGGQKYSLYLILS